MGSPSSEKAHTEPPAGEGYSEAVRFLALCCLAAFALSACGGSGEPTTVTETAQAVPATGEEAIREAVTSPVTTLLTSHGPVARCAVQSDRWLRKLYGNVSDLSAACLDAEAEFVAQAQDQIPAPSDVVFGNVKITGDKAIVTVQLAKGLTWPTGKARRGTRVHFVTRLALATTSPSPMAIE